MFRSLLLASFFIATIGSNRIHAQSCTDTLVLYYSPEFVEPGASFCIDFKVKNFDCIVGFQFAISWDTASVGYISARGLGISGLYSNNFNAQGHKVSCSWISPSGEGITVDDGTVLFQLCGMNPDRQNARLAMFELETGSNSILSESINCLLDGECIVLEEVLACSNYFRYQPVTRRSINGYDCRDRTSEVTTAYVMQNSAGEELVIDPEDANGIAVCIDEDWTIRPMHSSAYRSSPSFRPLETGTLGNLINGNVIRDTFCLIPTSAKRNGPGEPTVGGPFHPGSTLEDRESGNSNDFVDVALEVFPNPVEGQSTVVADSEIMELVCMDLFGKVVFSAENRSGSSQYIISCDNFSPGVYLIRVKTKAGWASTRVVVK